MPEVVVDRYQDVWTVTYRGRGTDAYGNRDTAIKAAIDWATRLYGGGEKDITVTARGLDGGFTRVWSPEDADAAPDAG